MAGFIVTWDLDSRDPAQCARVRRFVYGQTLRQVRKVYRYAGFVDRPGVLYLGQSVLFVPGALLEDLQGFLKSTAVAHLTTHARLGARVEA